MEMRAYKPNQQTELNFQTNQNFTTRIINWTGRTKTNSKFLSKEQLYH